MRWLGWLQGASAHPVFDGWLPASLLQGNIRVFGRVRPITKEDGEGPEAANAVTFDADDDAVLYLLHKGKQVSFELDKVFPPQASQEEVRATIHTAGVTGGGSYLLLTLSPVSLRCFRRFKPWSPPALMATMSASLPMGRQGQEKPTQWR